MLLPRLAAVAVAAAFLLMPALAQEDAVGIPGPIVFEDVEFGLAWTSNPEPTYFKQEYLPEGEELESYEQMFLIDVLTEGATPEQAAGQMAAALEQRKADDPVVNFELIANEATGEYIIDFILSDSSTGITIIEWNAYRYVPHGEGLTLFAISRRGYDDGATAFIQGLAEWRTGTIDALASMELPEIALD